jgi:hypothetical protein
MWYYCSRALKISHIIIIISVSLHACLQFHRQRTRSHSASARLWRASTHRCKLSLIMLAVYSNHRLVVHNGELLSCLLAAADSEHTPQRKAKSTKPNDAASASASSKV